MRDERVTLAHRRGPSLESPNNSENLLAPEEELNVAISTEIIERHLTALERAVHELPELAQAWEPWLDPKHANFALNWRRLVTEGLSTLANAYQAGALIQPNRQRFVALCQRLGELIDTIHALELTPPTVEPVAA